MRLVHRSTSGRLPTSSYDLQDDAGAVIGYGQLRHRPSHGADLPDGAETHIYYEIELVHRRKGHGTTLLSLLLIEAHKIGLQEVRVGADADNVGSRRIIEANGGRLVATFGTPAGDVLLYEVRLT